MTDKVVKLQSEHPTPQPSHPIRIAVDITFLQDQYAYRGIGRYGREMVRRLIQELTSKRVEEYELHLIGFGNLDENFALLEFNSKTHQPENSSTLKFHSLGRPVLSSPLRNLWLYYFKIKPLVKKIKPDLYYAVHFDRGLPTKLVPTVVAIHDVIPLVTNSFSAQGVHINFLKGLFYKFMWRKVRNAKLVFTSSHFSKKDLVNYGGLNEARVKVIYLGISDIFRKQNIPNNDKIVYETLFKFGLQTRIKAGSPVVPKYLLYDGGLETNKNTDQLLQIFAKLAVHIPDLLLMVVGKDFELKRQEEQEEHTRYVTPQNERAERFIQQAVELGLENKLVPTGKVSESDLAILFSQAWAYINLSRYEGFGFGPVQAMAAGIPAIISNRSSFPEVAGDAGLVVDLDDDLKATAQILEMLSSDESRKEIVAKGLKLSEKYNWDNTFAESWQEITKLQLRS